MTSTKTLGQLTVGQLEDFLSRENRLKVVNQGIRSPYFDIQPGIIVDADGNPQYDRPVIYEKPSVFVVVWGRDEHGQLRLGMIRQKRPPADDPMVLGNNHPPVVFAQVVMGYRDGDSIKKAALKERAEEAGKAKVLDIVELPFPHFNIEPNTYGSWHSLAFVEVDLSTIDEGYSETGEMITSTMYQLASEVFVSIVHGKDETGAYYRGGSTLGPLMVFFAWIFSKHPDLFPRP